MRAASLSRRLAACCLLLSVLPAQAASVEIGQQLINSFVAAKFPLEKLSVTVRNPLVKFHKQSQRAEFCGDWISRIPVQAGSFCVDATPKWDKTHGDVVITGLQTTKVDVGSDRTVSPAVLKAFSSTLLPLLDGTPIYHAPGLIGKMIDRIGVTDSGVQVFY